MESSVNPQARSGRVFAAAFVLIGLLSSLWALATPIFASPDENAHAVKAIAQVRGELFGHSREGVRFPVYDLPDDYRYSPGIVCFAFHPEVPADCGVELGTPLGTNWSDDWVSTYNPVYYYAVGWITLLLPGSAGVYGMRILSALLSSALLAAAFIPALAGRRARWMAAGLAFAIAPMSLFLDGSVNPQAMEFNAAVLLTVSLVRLIEKLRDPESVAASRTALWVLTAVGACLLAIARATGPIWVVVIVFGVMLASGLRDSLVLFRQRSSYPWIVLIAVAGAFSLGWTLLTGTLAGQAEKADAPLVGGSAIDAVKSMLRSTPSFVQAAIGSYGWQDTTPPALVYAPAYGALAIFFALAVFATARRERRVVLLALAVAVVAPVVVQAASVSKTGIIWQGRYGMFLYLAVIVAAAWGLSRSADRIAWLSVRMSAVIGGLIALYGVATFFVVLRRYVVGTDATFNKMFTAPQWQPPLGWATLMACMVVVSAIYFVWNWRIAAIVARREDAAPFLTSPDTADVVR